MDRPAEAYAPIVWDDDVPLLTVLDLLRREKGKRDADRG